MIFEDAKTSTPERVLWRGTLGAVIQFDQGTHRFNYRVAGVAIHDGKVLLQTAAGESSWALPGGRAEMGEAAEDTLKREMREELATDVEVLRPLWVVENFFDYAGLSYHELGLYFLIRFPAGSPVLTECPLESWDGGTRLEFRWHPLETAFLSKLPLLPSFLASSLSTIPGSVTHVVHRD